jgi:hypothetical protein
MAQTYIQQMTERHAVVLLEFQKQLRQDLASKPPKWSKELLDQRRKQHINARNKNYTLAQKLKKQSDKTEERERREMEQAQAVIFARREAKFRMQQQTELQALLKRIECRRKEHIKQRNLDTKRLLQRNRNVQAVLESKQATECQKLFAEIKKTLYSTAALHGGQPTSVHGSTRRTDKSTSSLQKGKTQAAMAASQAHYDQVAQAQYSSHLQQQQQRESQQQRQQYQQQQPQSNASSPERHYYQSESKHPEESYYEQSPPRGGAVPMPSGYGGSGGGRAGQDADEEGAEDYAGLDEENDEAVLKAHASAPQPDPAFMQAAGPNFTNLVYAPGDSYEDESVDEGLVYE